MIYPFLDVFSYCENKIFIGGKLDNSDKCKEVYKITQNPVN